MRMKQEGSLVTVWCIREDLSGEHTHRSGPRVYHGGYTQKQKIEIEMEALHIAHSGMKGINLHSCGEKTAATNTLGSFMELCFTEAT